MNFVHPHFAEPRWFWLAVLGPVVVAALQGYSAWARRKQLARIAAPHFVAELTRTHSPARRAAKGALLVLAVAGMGLALARPQWGEVEQTGQSLGQDIVFLLDCSRSMLAADVTPNRLQRAKLAIMDFVQRYGHGRFGLVAFAGQAFLQCPLTFDYSAFEDALMACDDKTIPILGTDVGVALNEGFRAMEKGAREKVLGTLQDPKEESGVAVARALASRGVVIFTVGVGTPAGAEIQIFDEHGKPMLLRDDRGEVVRSRLDEETLRSIAISTRGAYYPLGQLGEGLGKVRLAMGSLPPAAGATPTRKLGVDRFHWPVAAVLVLLVAESLIGTRRRQLEPFSSS